MKEEGTRKQETEVKEIRKFLDTLKMPERLITKTTIFLFRETSYGNESSMVDINKWQLNKVRDISY